MSSSIYNIQAWQNNFVYVKNDIIVNGNFFYYSRENHTSHPSDSFSTTIINNPTLWGGVETDNVFNIQRSSFIWAPSYSSNVEVTPAVKRIQFGGGYEQRVEDGINNILLQINLKFDQRDINEATAIIHFLTKRRGVESFLYTPAPPYNTQGRYVCRSWSHVSDFYNNISISAKFDQVTE